MALILCPSCGAEVSNMAAACPKCGAPINSTNHQSNEDRVNMFLATHSSKLPAASIPQIRQMLLAKPEKINVAMAVDYKDPMIAFVLCFLLGGLGIHRFFIGDTGIGVAQLVLFWLTCTASSIWAIVDLFLIWDATRQKNYEALMFAINC